jgi:hypothetical protein
MSCCSFDNCNAQSTVTSTTTTSYPRCNSNNKIFNSYTGNTDTAVNGGRELIEFLRSGRFNKPFLASCDAVALYPSVWVQEGLELLEQKIKKDQKLEKVTDHQRRRLWNWQDSAQKILILNVEIWVSIGKNRAPTWEDLLADCWQT